MGSFLRKTHLGLWVFTGLKVAVFFFLCNGKASDFGSLLLLYAITLMIAITPIGEMVMCIFNHAWRTPRRDMLEYVQDIVADIVVDVKEKSCHFSGDLHFKIIETDEPCACAIGFKTIAFSAALLDLSYDEIQGVLAGEIAHLVLRHNIWMMLAGCANPLALLLYLSAQFVRLVFALVAILVSIFSSDDGSRRFTIICAMIVNAMIKVWMAFCMLFVALENRQSVLLADEYVAELGYGEGLARAIDELRDLQPKQGFMSALYMMRPNADARIENLINHGVTYRRY